MFSGSKLVVTLALIGVGLAVARFLQRKSEALKARRRVRGARGGVIATVRCPRCGAYVSEGASHACKG